MTHTPYETGQQAFYKLKGMRTVDTVHGTYCMWFNNHPYCMHCYMNAKLLYEQ